MLAPAKRVAVKPGPGPASAPSPDRPQPDTSRKSVSAGYTFSKVLGYGNSHSHSYGYSYSYSCSSLPLVGRQVWGVGRTGLRLLRLVGSSVALQVGMRVLVCVSVSVCSFAQIFASGIFARSIIIQTQMRCL